jgi:hypothetical protein
MSLESRVIALCNSDKKLLADTVGEAVREYLFDEDNRFGYHWEPRPELNVVNVVGQQKREFLEKVGIFWSIHPDEQNDPILIERNQRENQAIVEQANVVKFMLDSKTQVTAAWHADGDMQFAIEIVDLSDENEEIILYNSDAKKDYTWEFRSACLPLIV